jgi:hypothetical protein
VPIHNNVCIEINYVVRKFAGEFLRQPRCAGLDLGSFVNRYRFGATTLVFKHDLAAIENSMGTFRVASGRRQDAAGHLHRAVVLAEELLAADPGEPEYRFVLAHFLGGVGSSNAILLSSSPRSLSLNTGFEGSSSYSVAPSE